METEEIYVFRKGVHHIEKQYGTRFNEEDLPRLAALDHTVPYGTVLSGDAFQALRAWLLSCCPSGTKTIRPSKRLALTPLMGGSAGLPNIPYLRPLLQ
jgi:hypothetical protein